MYISKHSQSQLSVIVVSDYEANEEKTWKDERRILHSLANQDLDDPFDVILLENDNAKDSVPQDLYNIYPRFKIIFTNESKSAKLKDEGVKHVKTEYVAVFEADCLPNREWLRVLYDTLRQHKDFSIASGRTTYGHETMYKRCLGLLDRSFDNLGHAGETCHVSNNGAIYRTSVLKEFPYPDAITPFSSSRMRMKTMIANGHKFYFEPKAAVHHAIGGLNFIRDFRRNTGYADMMEHTKKQFYKIPKLLWERFKIECSDCLRLGPNYLKWYDWLLLMLLLFIAPFFEIPGMLDVIRKKNSIPLSSYR
jgi:hypothetical protein